MTSEQDSALVEELTRAIFDAEDTSSGDHVGTVIYSAEHAFYDIQEGESETDACRKWALGVCGDAAQAILPIIHRLTTEAHDAGVAEAHAWRDIASAPKDGKLVLLTFDDARICIGAWERHEDSSYPFVWKDSYGSVIVRGWKDDPEPTHWQPLPSPPASSDGG